MDFYLALGAQLFAQIALVAYLWGKMSQKTRDLEDRVKRIERGIDKFTNWYLEHE